MIPKEFLAIINLLTENSAEGEFGVSGAESLDLLTYFLFGLGQVSGSRTVDEEILFIFQS